MQRSYNAVARRMMRIASQDCVVGVLIAVTAPSWGVPANAQASRPATAVGAVVRVSAPGLIGSATAVRAMTDGRLLVNDIKRRQVVLLSAALSQATVVVDSSKLTGGTLGLQPGGIIAYGGDSTLFVDPASLSMLLLDPNGRIARVMAAPRPQEVAYLVGGPFGTPAFDLQGRLVYRGYAQPKSAERTGLPSDMPFQLPQAADSAPIVRLNLSSRKLDTVATYKVGKTDSRLERDEAGRLGITTTVNPMQTVDDWAVLSDGTLAVLRGRDFRIDYVNMSTGSVTVAKIPFAWRRMTDVEQAAVLDSARILVAKELAAIKAKVIGQSAPTPTRATSADGIPPSRNASGTPEPRIVVVEAGALPEYRPAFQAGSVRADPVGNLWVRTSEMVRGAQVYDVINRSGGVVERIVLPLGRVLVGFGSGETLFMAYLDAEGARIEEARIH